MIICGGVYLADDQQGNVNYSVNDYTDGGSIDIGDTEE